MGEASGDRKLVQGYTFVIQPLRAAPSVHHSKFVI